MPWAADSDMEKTEDPTGKKLSEAAEKGNIARSQDLGTALVLLGSSVGILMYGAELAEATLQVCRRLLSLNQKDVQDPTMMSAAAYYRLSCSNAGIFEIVSGDPDRRLCRQYVAGWF